MNFSHFFIDRPIFAGVISIILTIVGAIAYFALPVSEYPQIAPPTVVVTASYPGASAEVVADTVAAPLEQEINGVEGMLYMLSAGDGRRQQVDHRGHLQARHRHRGRPGPGPEPGLDRRATACPRRCAALVSTLRKSSPDLMMVIHMTVAGRLARPAIHLELCDAQQVKSTVLARVDGVGERATVFAARAYSMRIWLDPELVAARGLTAGEVVAGAARRQHRPGRRPASINQPAGAGPKAAFELLRADAQGRLDAIPRQFSSIIVDRDTERGRRP